ncbi:MAG: ABC transporter permease [Lachnospiraceae bacterium]|nr:ABC transporter permease [Lachnospiraceae bacterium]
MKKFLQRLSGKQLILLCTGILSCIVGLLINGVGGYMTGKLDTQNMAERWSEDGDVSQISCFFSREAEMTENNLINFEHALDAALEEASIVNDSENAGARLWADAYSASGRITLTSQRASVEVNAVGVGGDFFLFHPLKLLAGAYFSGSDLMQDHIVIDEDAAWQLFGSNDVDGQMITIGGVPHMIAGVIRREDGRMANAAGLSSSVVYVSYSTLEKYGTNYGLNTYELVMPNPVTGYAKNYVMENIGVTENEVEIVENTTRYGLLARLKLLAQFPTRSMSSKAIIYPYWENIARGYEDILTLLLVLTLLFILYPAILLIILIVRAWKHKTWTVAGVWHKVKDKIERLREKLWAVQAKNKERKAAGLSPKAKKPKREKKVKEKKVKGKKLQKEVQMNEEENYEKDE